MALTEINSKSIKDGDITEDDIAISNAPSDGKFLQYKDSSDKLTWATVSTDVVADTSPQLGGDLDTNDHEILLDDAHAVKFGADNDLIIKEDSGNSYLTGRAGSTLNLGIGSDTDMLEIDSASVNLKSNTTLKNSAVFDVLPGSWIRTFEPSSDGTNYLQFGTRALTNNHTFYWNTEGATEGQYLKLGSNANLQFADVTAGATGGSTDKIFWENGQTVTTNYTLGDTFGAAANAMSAGPITINNGVTVTINSGETWTIV
jgi:hypothetical protein